MSKVNRKSIWIVTELYYPSETSTGFILTKLAEELSQKYDVRVLTGPTSYTSDSGSYKLDEDVNGVHISRVRLPYLNKNSTIKRLVRLLLLSVKLGVEIIRHVKGNSTLVVVTNPVPLLFFVSFIKLFKKQIRLIILVHDVYPDNMAVAGMLKKKGFVFKTIDRLFSSSLKQADQVIVLGRDMKEMIESKGVTKIRIIENWAESCRISDTTHLLDSSMSRLATDKHRIRFLFAGNLGRVQGIPLLLEAIEYVAENRASFQFAGNGVCSNLIHKESNNQISHLGCFSRADEGEVLGGCDIGIVTLAPGMYGLGVPSKAYNIMRAGKPILYIGDSNSEIDRVVRENSCGWTINEFDPKIISEKILEICNEPMQVIREKGKNARRLGNDVFTLTKSLEKYESVLSEDF